MPVRRHIVAMALAGMALAACTPGAPEAPTATPGATSPVPTTPVATLSASPSAGVSPTATSAPSTSSGAQPTPCDPYYGDCEGSVRTQPPAGDVTVQSITYGDVGAYLAGPNRMALYTFDRDDPDRSSCTDECAEAWPPLTLPMGEEPAAGPGIDGSLGIFQRADGTWQVTLDGAALYFFAGDEDLYDTTGDGLNGVWHLARP